MKIRSIVVIMILSLMFIQCRKDTNEKPPPDLKTGLLAYFRLNGNFEDSTTNVLDATYGGFLSYAKNRHGYEDRAVSFNGGMFSFFTDDWPATNITVSLWIKPKDLNNEGYLILSNEWAFGVRQAGSKIGFEVSVPGTELALADITVEWTHFAGTYDGQDIKTYINGKLAKTVHHPGVPDVTGFINVGAAGLPEWMGALDDLRFYNRVLGEEEIRLLSQL